jgi:hypothetical protein
MQEKKNVSTNTVSTADPEEPSFIPSGVREFNSLSFKIV